MARNDNLNYEIGGILGGSAEGNQGIYEESSTAKYPLGQKLELIDGRVFRYANFDAACTVGKLVGPDFSTGGAVEISDGTIATGGAGSSVVTLTMPAKALPIALRPMVRLVVMRSNLRFTIRSSRRFQRALLILLLRLGRSTMFMLLRQAQIFSCLA